MRRAKKIALGLLVLAAFGLVGQMDYEDELAQHAHCLDMVEFANHECHRREAAGVPPPIWRRR